MILENGESVKIKPCQFSFHKNRELIEAEDGTEFEIDSEKMTIAGIVDGDDATNADGHKNKIACRIGGEELYRLHSEEEIKARGEKFENKFISFDRLKNWLKKNNLESKLEGGSFEALINNQAYRTAEVR